MGAPNVPVPAGQGGSGGPGGPGAGEPPEAPPPGSPEGNDADDPRRTAHELVAQAEALLHIVGQPDHVSLWWPQDVPDVSPTFPELAVQAGRAHAEIASGVHDPDLADRFGNPLGRPKRHLLRRLLVRIQDSVHNDGFQSAIPWIKTAIGVASSALGSMSFIPGVGAIQEGLDLASSGLETAGQLGTPPPKLPDKPSRSAAKQG